MGKEIDGTWFSAFIIILIAALLICLAITISDEKSESSKVDYFKRHSEIK